MYVADTIVAVATAPGPAPVGILRISGPQAAVILARLQSKPDRGEPAPSHQLRLMRIVATDGSLIDQALGVLMRAPSSYTGEDVAEIQCHGGPALLRLVLATALAHGARLAEPGEFTRRAFLNGRLDLVQAEAIDDLIRARGRSQAAVAAQQVAGNLSRELGATREQLIELKALLEVQIDFSEEDVTIDRNQLIGLATLAAEQLDRLVASYDRGRLLREGPRIAIVGKPNVGKSSLLNALLGEDRAIVTEIAGTTRDVIEESVELEGMYAVLTDTAGLRDEAAADRVERLGIGRTHGEIEAADCVLLVVDGSARLSEDDRGVSAATASARRVLVVNKSDLPQATDAEIGALAPEAPLVRVSAKDGTGLVELRVAILQRLEAVPFDNPASPLVTRLRHRDALAKAGAAVRLALASLGAEQPPDLVAVDVQEALDQIAQVTGTITPEDILDRIFSRFCLGK